MKINGLKKLTTDVLIIGGGTAGCYAALTIKEQSDTASIIIAEKANIKEVDVLQQVLMQSMLISLRAEFHRIMLIIVRKMHMEL